MANTSDFTARNKMDIIEFGIILHNHLEFACILGVNALIFLL
jgi:hypothetical protein